MAELRTAIFSKVALRTIRLVSRKVCMLFLGFNTSNKDISIFDISVCILYL